MGTRVVIASLFGLFLSCAADEPPRRGPEPSAFQTAKVESLELANTLRIDGLLKPEQIAQIRVRIAGFVEKINFREGDIVRKGDVLLQLDARMQELAVETARVQILGSKATLELAEAQRKFAEVNVARLERLFQNRAISDEELSRGKAELDTARGKINEARAALNRAELLLRQAQMELDSTRVLAPFDGVILERSITVGETATPTGDRVLLLGSAPTILVFRGLIDPRDADVMRVGMPLKIDNTEYKIERIVPVLRDTEEIPRLAIEALVANPTGKLQPFRKVTAEIEIGKAVRVLVVPMAATRWRPLPEEVDPAIREAYREAKYAPPMPPAGMVTLLTEGKLRPTRIEVIGGAGDLVAIRGNVKAGDVVVIGRKGLE